MNGNKSRLNSGQRGLDRSTLGITAAQEDITHAMYTSCFRNAKDLLAYA